MGMFDNLKIRSTMLPLTEEELVQLGAYHDWQTKDFECILGIAEITDSGNLRFKNSFVYDEPEEERKVFSTKLNRKNDHWRDLNLTGHVNFYSFVSDHWFEFRAHFTNGKLNGIERIADESTEENN
jgi:hypothetical protein